MEAGWSRRRLAVLRAEPICRVCRLNGVTSAAIEVDHIMPRSLGGTSDEANLQPICRACHQRKTANESHWARRLVAEATG